MLATPKYVKMLYNSGWTIAKISSKLKISQMTVCCLLSEPS